MGGSKASNKKGAELAKKQARPGIPRNPCKWWIAIGHKPVIHGISSDRKWLAVHFSHIKTVQYYPDSSLGEHVLHHPEFGQDSHTSKYS